MEKKKEKNNLGPKISVPTVRDFGGDKIILVIVFIISVGYLIGFQIFGHRLHLICQLTKCFSETFISFSLIFGLLGGRAGLGVLKLYLV